MADGSPELQPHRDGVANMLSIFFIRDDSKSFSNPKRQPRAFSPPTPRSTTPSTPNDISSADRTSGSFARGLVRLGQRLPPEI